MCGKSPGRFERFDLPSLPPARTRREKTKIVATITTKVTSVFLAECIASLRGTQTLQGLTCASERPNHRECHLLTSLDATTSNLAGKGLHLSVLVVFQSRTPTSQTEQTAAISLRSNSQTGIQAAVLNGLTCPDAQRGYRHAIDEFVDQYCSEPRLAFNRTVLRYRSHRYTDAIEEIAEHKPSRCRESSFACVDLRQWPSDFDDL